jgi:hypothetical protein
MKVTCKAKHGGAVKFNAKDGAWASYSVAEQYDGILYAGVKLESGRHVQLFVNRKTGLIVVDVIDKGGRGGNEILRRTV